MTPEKVTYACCRHTVVPYLLQTFESNNELIAEQPSCVFKKCIMVFTVLAEINNTKYLLDDNKISVHTTTPYFKFSF